MGCKDIKTIDTMTYNLLTHKEWNSGQYECNDINITDTTTYSLLADQE